MKNTYTTAYRLLCESNKDKEEQWKPVGSKLARHRINPGHNGGEYVPDNCTYLTLDQHILAHWLLWKIYGRVEDKVACSLMRGIDPSHYPSFLGKTHSEEAKAKISATLTGRKLSEETKAKISAATKGRKLPPRSEEHKAKIGAANAGLKRSEEHKAKIGAANKDKTVSEETKAKMSAAHKARWAKRKQLKDP